MTTPTPDITDEDVERTVLDVARAQWGVAGVVMLGNVIAGGATFHLLSTAHVGPVLSSISGGITALAVDYALLMWLRISRRLRAMDVESRWGRALELTTALMTLTLAAGAALSQGFSAKTVALAVAYSFLPIILVLVTKAGAEAQAALQRLRRARVAPVSRDTATEASSARDSSDQAISCEADAKSDPATAGISRTPLPVARSLTALSREAESVASPRAKPAKRDTIATVADRVAWVHAERVAGRDPRPCDVDAEFGTVRGGSRIIRLADEQGGLRVVRGAR